MKGKQIYWEDVEVGQEIPGYSMEITWTTVTEQTSGSQDFHEVHHDPDIAKADNRPNIFMNTGFSQGVTSRVMADWIGDKGFLTFFNMELRKMNLLHDTMVFKGKVTEKYVKDDKHYVDADVWVENDREGGVTTIYKASAILPTRG